MKRKALKQKVDDLEQRVARLETLDDQTHRDVLFLKSVAAHKPFHTEPRVWHKDRFLREVPDDQ
jgi:hypothetical protein